MAQNEKNIGYLELPHILVVDDDERICDLVSRYLVKHDFVVLCAHTAKEARDLLSYYMFDAMILDVMMPGETGLEFAVALRKDPVHKALPIIMLTALGEVDDRILGFEVGVDDYLAKPFEARELLMRIQAILRRTLSAKKMQKEFRIGSYKVDLDGMVLHGDKGVLRLTEMEVKLLGALLDHNGEAVSREQLSEICELDGGERTIDVQVTRLRRKIEPDSKVPRYLQTIRGKGYLLRAEVLDA